MPASAADLIAAYNAKRDLSRLALKYQAMYKSQFSFLRGTAHLFHQRMHELGISPGGPPAWICGDLHLENFGTYLAENELSYFDVNDFDECAVAPCSWDILRLATSILVAAPSYKLEPTRAAELAMLAITSYLAELGSGKAKWIERKSAEGVIGDLMDKLSERDPVKFVAKRTKDERGENLDTSQRKMQAVASEKERKDVCEFIQSDKVGGSGKQEYKFLDVAYRIAGTGSLGVTRYVVLAETLAEPTRKLLLDLKLTLKSSAAPVSGIPQPEWKSESQRVVEVQKIAQVRAPHLLKDVEIDDHPFVLRELQPTSDKLKLEKVAEDPKHLSATIVTMGSLAAWMQLRTAGHRTAAPGDTLVGFAQDKTLAKKILAAAQVMEKSTLDDHKAYSAAFKAGAFAETMEHFDPTKGDEAE